MEKALIFGASSKLAQSLALSLVENSLYEVCLVGHKNGFESDNPAIKVIRDCDVTNWNSVKNVFENCISNDFVPTAVVNCTGTSGQCSITDMSYEEWRRVMGVNLDGAFNICQNAISFLKDSDKHTNIVLIGSAYGVRYVPNLVHYCTSKAAISALVGALSVEAAKYDISIGTVIPSMFLSNMTAPFYEDTQYIQKLKEHFPSGRLIDIESVVNSIVFLLNEKGMSLNGVEIKVDGGFLNRIEGGMS